MTKSRDISASRIARSLTFLVMSFFISWLAQSGKLSKLVHPRMNLWIEGAGVLFLVLGFVQTLRLAERPKRPDPASFFVPIAFILAIVLIFVQSNSFSPGPFDAGDDSLAAAESTIAKRDKAAAKASMGPLPQLLAFDEDRYWALYNRLYDDPAAALGHRVEIRGFLSRAKGFPSETALVGRNLMWCCSADMSTVGLLAQGSALGGLPDSTWVEATGRLSTIEFDVDRSGKESLLPLLVLDSVKPADKGSASGVIFPF
jgi:uncharacterized repeat protein (TIGR03943 family)